MLSCLLLAGSSASAQRSPQIRLSAGASCLEARLLGQRVRAWLADAPTHDGCWLEVRGSERDPRSVDVILHQADGRTSARSFSPGPERCADLHDAVALAGALLLRSASVPADVPPAPDPPPLEQEAAHLPTQRGALRRPTVPAARPAIERSGSPPRVSSWPELELGLAGALASHVNTSLSGGVRVLLGMRVPPGLDLRLVGLGLFGRPEPLPAQSGAYTVRIAAAAFDGCVRWHASGSFVGRYCSAFAAGQLRATGSALHVNVSSPLRWLALSTGPELLRRVAGNTWLSLSGLLVLPLQLSQVALADSAGQPLPPVALPALGFALFAGLSYVPRAGGGPLSEQIDEAPRKSGIATKAFGARGPE